jgi:uncharacterized membrane protein
MTELPDFWRTEVWHPLAVHLPLAALLLATLAFMVSLFLKKQAWYQTGVFLIISGTLGAWVAVYTGSMADAVVVRGLCDPTVLESHENQAYLTSWIFTLASVTSLSFYLKKLKIRQNVIKILVVVFALTGSVFLARVGHLGATLVYQQAAGVYVPSEDCSEFQ